MLTFNLIKSIKADNYKCFLTKSKTKLSMNFQLWEISLASVLNYFELLISYTFFYEHVLNWIRMADVDGIQFLFPQAR